MGQMRSVPAWWVPLTEGYLRWLARRGRRPNTLRAYGFELDDFGHWLLEERVSAPSDLQRSHIEAWQDELQERKSPKTQQVAASAVRGLLRWAADQELPIINPTLWLRVETPRVPPFCPRPIPKADLERIQQALDCSSELHGLRTRALFWVIFSSGARISEALSLMRGSIVDGIAQVIQKGGRPHVLVINSRAQRAVDEYLRERADSVPTLFASLDHPGLPLGKKETQDGWNRLCAELGIKRFTTHQIRHSTVTTLRRNGVDIVVIAKTVGHRGLQAIMAYVEIDLDERRKAVALLDGALAGIGGMR